MNGHARSVGYWIALAVLSLGLLGSNDDGGCGEKSAKDLCKDTGGTWAPGDFWPTACGDDPSEKKGPPVAKAGDSVCACPADKPNWTDGVGCRKCETVHELCSRTGGSYGPGAYWPTKCGDDPLDTKGPAAAPGQNVCTCPGDRPNWTDGTGCHKCGTLRETCISTGGTWGLGDFWPTKCGDDPLDTKGPAAKPGEKVCACPADKPNWSADKGCQKCGTVRETCTGTGGTWGAGPAWPPACGDDPRDVTGPAAKPGEKVCTCPSNKPNWVAGTGCTYCKSQHEYCTDSGGTWDFSSNWPAKCGDDPLDTKGPAATPGLKVCLCPANRPNWTANKGCEKCDTVRELCWRTGGSWGPGAYWPTLCGDDPAYFLGPAAAPGAKVCSCPSNAPNWTDGVGCRSCAPVGKGACRGDETECSELSNYEAACNAQQGCYFVRSSTTESCSASSSGSGGNNPYDPGSDDNSYDPYGSDDSSYDPYGSSSDASYDSYDPYSAAGVENPYDPNYQGEYCYYTSGTCGGYSSTCSSFSTQTSCYLQRGCNWKMQSVGAGVARGQCAGYSADCSNLSSSEEACWSQIGCHYHGDSASCGGASNSCSSIGDELVCAMQRGCYWKALAY